MPFINFCEAFLKMSDGWIMHETRIQAGVEMNSWGGYNHSRVGSLNAEKLYDYITTCDESEYLYIMSYYLGDTYHTEERRFAKVETFEINSGTPNAWTRKSELYDCKYSQSLLRGRVFETAKRAKEIHVIKEVKPSNRAVTNSV
jgi:hypothetical protein